MPTLPRIWIFNRFITAFKLLSGKRRCLEYQNLFQSWCINSVISLIFKPNKKIPTHTKISETKSTGTDQLFSTFPTSTLTEILLPFVWAHFHRKALLDSTMADRLGESQWGDNVSARFPDPGNPGTGDNPAKPNSRLLELSRLVLILDRRFSRGWKLDGLSSV